MAACAAAVSAAADTELKVTEVGVSRQDGGITVTMAIDPRDVNPGRDREVVFTPVVVSASGTDSVVMPQIRVAGRNRYYQALRHDLEKREGVTLVRSGDQYEVIASGCPGSISEMDGRRGDACTLRNQGMLLRRSGP